MQYIPQNGHISNSLQYTVDVALTAGVRAGAGSSVGGQTSATFGAAS